eukprot:3033869-Pyramimonas_sp.AAC.1
MRGVRAGGPQGRAAFGGGGAAEGGNSTNGPYFHPIFATQEEDKPVRGRRWVAPAFVFFPFLALVVFAILSVIQVTKLDELKTTTDDLFMDLSKAEPDMRVTFDVYNPSILHGVGVRDMSCDVLVYQGEREQLQMLGKLVSDVKMHSKPGRQTIQHSTSLINVGDVTTQQCSNLLLTINHLSRLTACPLALMRPCVN